MEEENNMNKINPTYEEACAEARTRPAYSEARELLQMRSQRVAELAQIEKMLDDVSRRDEMAWSMALLNDSAALLASVGEVRG